MVKTRIVPWLALLLAGCATAPLQPGVDSVFADHLFPDSGERVPSPGEIFALSEPMRRYLAGEVAAHARTRGPRMGLLAALEGELRIEYDAAITRTATETFAARSGNCLSLVIMTAALARELGVPVRYQEVRGFDPWSRSAGMAFHSGHVNLVLGSSRRASWFGVGVDDAVVVDFVPAQQMRGHYAGEIPEDLVVAMFLNNRAAEILSDGDAARAYVWAREAVRRFPAFTGAYNTLGVIYLRQGHAAQAERALAQALEREPGHFEALSNLARVYEAQGRAPEAQALRKRLAEMAPYPPFHFFDEGLAALRRGDDAAALALFQRELQRMPYADDLHFAIALVNLRLGDAPRAREHLRLARDSSLTRDQRALYAAKLRHLETLR